MKTVWKFHVPVKNERRISLEVPRGAVPLHVGVALDPATGAEAVYLWAQVDNTQPSESLPIWVAATGAALDRKSVV